MTGFVSVLLTRLLLPCPCTRATTTELRDSVLPAMLEFQCLYPRWNGNFLEDAAAKSALRTDQFSRIRAGQPILQLGRGVVLVWNYVQRQLWLPVTKSTEYLRWCYGLWCRYWRRLNSLECQYIRPARPQILVSRIYASRAEITANMLFKEQLDRFDVSGRLFQPLFVGQTLQFVLSSGFIDLHLNVEPVSRSADSAYHHSDRVSGGLPPGLRVPSR